MKSTIIAILAAGLALSGASISYAAPLTGDDSSIRARAVAQEAIFEILARTLADADLLEYSTRAYEDSSEVIWARDPTDGIKKVVHAQKAVKKIHRRPGEPKKPLSNFMFFSHENRERVKPENPDGAFGHIAQALGGRK